MYFSIIHFVWNVRNSCAIFVFPAQLPESFARILQHNELIYICKSLIGKINTAAEKFEAYLNFKSISPNEYKYFIYDIDMLSEL